MGSISEKVLALRLGKELNETLTRLANAIEKSNELEEDRIREKEEDRIREKEMYNDS